MTKTQICPHCGEPIRISIWDSESGWRPKFVYVKKSWRSYIPCRQCGSLLHNNVISVIHWVDVALALAFYAAVLFCIDSRRGNKADELPLLGQLGVMAAAFVVAWLLDRLFLDVYLHISHGRQVFHLFDAQGQPIIRKPTHRAQYRLATALSEKSFVKGNILRVGGSEVPCYIALVRILSQGECTFYLLPPEQHPSLPSQTTLHDETDPAADLTDIRPIV